MTDEESRDLDNYSEYTRARLKLASVREFYKTSSNVLDSNTPCPIPAQCWWWWWWC